MNLPKKIRIVEVGPRDGFQNIKQWIDTPVKIKAAEMLLDAGVNYLEAVSFVSPKAVPQMQDAQEVIAAIKPNADMSRIFALIGNDKGAIRAHEAGVKNLTAVISASEAHNMANVRKTPAESLLQLEAILNGFPQMHAQLSLATAFGCPFTGEVSNEKIFYVLDRGIELGICDITLCDTVGVGTPTQTERLLDDIKERYYEKNIEWALHLHNTRGMALANILVALSAGIERFETSVAGLGGCPFAPGASGNLATEDLVYMAREMGIETDVNLNKLIMAAEYITKHIGCCADSKINAVTLQKVKESKGG